MDCDRALEFIGEMDLSQEYGFLVCKRGFIHGVIQANLADGGWGGGEMGFQGFQPGLRALANIPGVETEREADLGKAPDNTR